MVGQAKVAVLKTSPWTVIDDYYRLLHLLDYQRNISPQDDLLLKLNLSWTRYFPACSTAPWQLEGVVRTLIRDDFSPGKIFPIENRTVVTDPQRGVWENRWGPILREYGLVFIPLTEVEWVSCPLRGRFLRLDQLFPEGVEIPQILLGKKIIHLPTMKTHGHTVITGAVKNAFGGLLKETRHYAHKYIHEVLVDIMYIQKEIHPSILAVMDATVCGDGAGPRTLVPRIKNYILASDDPVALDAVAAKMMGYDPFQIPFIRLCHEKGLGVGDPHRIRIIGEDISGVNFGFHTRRSLVIWVDQLLRRGPLRVLEKIALHSPLMIWAPIASHIYHDYIWYPLIGRKRLHQFKGTEWGQLFHRYPR